MYEKRIKEERQQKNFSQEQLAEMISTTQSTIVKYEREELQPNVEVSADYLLGLTD